MSKRVREKADHGNAVRNAAMLLSNRNQSYAQYNGCELILVLVRAGLCF